MPPQNRIIADLHLHSRYSRAVSQEMVLPTMAEWGIKKGVNLLGTADFTHPLWFNQIKAELEEKQPGIFQLKQKDYSAIRFVLTTEISSIYKQGERVRRIHNLIVASSFAAAEKINSLLRQVHVNLSSDGRPITGLSSLLLADLVFRADPQSLIIPCHIWTPWFSLYGANSGFDTLAECFGHFSDRITAVETGLSSDPAMNWQIKELENRQIVSFSDAHNPTNIGREATVLSGKSGRETFSFSDLADAMDKSKMKDWQVDFTIEFYPEEGKYHFSGHRKCGICFSPTETKTRGTTCPVCGKPLTPGVASRVGQLATINPVPIVISQKGITYHYHPQKLHHAFVSLVPLLEILAEVCTTGPNSKKVANLYQQMIDRFNNEMKILLDVPCSEIQSAFGEKVEEGIRRVREGKISVNPGYDGVYGQVKIWPQSQNGPQQNQMSLF